jgi:hypothetical protein
MRCLLSHSALLLLFATSPGAMAQHMELPVQQSRLAGYRYHGAPALRNELGAGEKLVLVRESSNPHDANAIRVEWQGIMLGYVPRTQNAALAWIMDRGARPSARIVAPRGKRARGLEFEIYL